MTEKPALDTAFGPVLLIEKVPEPSRGTAENACTRSVLRTKGVLGSRTSRKNVSATLVGSADWELAFWIVN